MNIPNDYPLWMHVTEACWRVMWRTIAVFCVCDAAPAGVLFGLRMVRVIVPKVAGAQ